VISVKPQPKPIVILTPQEIERPQVQNVVHFVEKTVKVDEIKEIKETKSTLSTTYEVVTQTTEGQKTVVVIVDNSNIKDVTLIDVVSEVKKTEQTQVASYTSISVNSASVKDTTTNDQTVVSSNKYVTMVLEEAIKYRPSLRGQSVVCFSEDVFKSSVQVTFIVSVNKRNVLISGFVYTQTNKVELVSIPDELESGLVASKYSSCSERSTSISTLTKETITVLSESSFEIQKLVSFVSSSFSFTVKDYERVIVEKFPHTIKYIIVVKTKTTTQRIVLIYQIRTISFTIIERPE
jgi:energy-converting hydrogenase A subunit M